MSKQENKEVKGFNNKETEDKDKKRSPIITVAKIVIPILAVYFGGVALFNYVFVPNTTFDGYNFSFKTPGTIADTMEMDTNSRTITLIEVDGEEDILLNDKVDYVKRAIEPAEGWISGNIPWLWPKFIFGKNELNGDIDVAYSKEKLESCVDGLKAMQEENIVKPQDAYLGRDGEKYVIVPEEMGNELIRDKVVAVLKKAIENYDTEIDLTEANCYTKPKVYKNDPQLTDSYNKYKTINFQRIILDMSGEEEVLETPDIIALYGEDGPSEELIYDYIQTLAEKYETYETERPFTDHYGDSIMVGTWADTYGFLIERDATMEVIKEAMESKKHQKIAPVWDSEAVVRNSDGSDIGSTYIEISIDNQALWGYLDGEEVISTSVVTGMYGRFDTPRGVFQILSKATNTRLKGQEGKEKWDSFVNFWMPINWTGVGLHNAPWRSAFGGTIYQGNGSHGCINMNYDAAEYIYNTFPYGTPVIIW